MPRIEVIEVGVMGPAGPQGVTGATANITATSGSSHTIGTGNKAFTVQAGRQIVVGDFVMVTRTSNPTTHWMYGQVTAYSGTSMTISVVGTLGSGSFNAWTISKSGVQGPTGATGMAFPGSTIQGYARQTSYNTNSSISTDVLAIDEADSAQDLLLPAGTTWAAMFWANAQMYRSVSSGQVRLSLRRRGVGEIASQAVGGFTAAYEGRPVPLTTPIMTGLSGTVGFGMGFRGADVAGDTVLWGGSLNGLLWRTS